MGKNRYINTKFWSDNFIVQLDPIERYLFLYFLTNEHTNLSGIYELPMRFLSFETGLEREMLEKILGRFKGKIYYIDGWVFVKNFPLHQSTKSKKIQIAILEAIKRVPLEIMSKIIEIEKDIDRVFIGYREVIIYLNSNFNSNSNLNLNLKRLEKLKKENPIGG